MLAKHLVQKSIVGIALVLFLGGGFTVASYSLVQQNNMVAEVNGDVVLRSDYAKAMTQARRTLMRQGLPEAQSKMMLALLEQSTLESLISQKLVEKSALQSGVQVSESEIDAEYQKYLLSRHKGDQKSLLRQLHGNGVSERGFRKQLFSHLIQTKMKAKIAKKTELTPAQLQAYYEEHKTEFQVPEKIKVRHILLKVLEPKDDLKVKVKAEKVISELVSGKPFDGMVKTYSEDELSQTSKGVLAPFAKGEMEVAFETAAWALKEGTFSKVPVKSLFGYHIILKDKTVPAHLQPLKEAKVLFQDRLLADEKKQAYDKWLKNLRAKASVKIKPGFQSTPAPVVPPKTSKQSSANPESPKK